MPEDLRILPAEGFICSKCKRIVTNAGDFPLWRHADNSLMCEDAEAIDSLEVSEAAQQWARDWYTINPIYRTADRLAEHLQPLITRAERAESTLSQIRQALEKLKPLEEKASPAPWIFESWLDPQTEILVSEPLEDSNYPNHHAPVLLRGYDEPDSTINSNWVLVQELRNAYPELLALVGKEK